jgi:hypothetical protein
VQSPKSPVRQLFEAIAGSERLQGVKVLFGARALADATAPPRILFLPTAAKYEVADYPVDNYLDAPIEVKLVIWGAGADQVNAYDNAVDVRNRVLQAAWDFQLATDSCRVRAVGEENEVDEDTNRQGHELAVTFIVREFVAKVPLSADDGEGEVDEVALNPAQ